MLNTTRFSGFSLLELLLTLAVVAVIMTLAAPSLSHLLRQHRLTAQANILLSHLQLARSEAIRRGVQVTIQRCSSQDSVWDNGWQVFTDWNGNGQLDTATGISDRCDERLPSPRAECQLAHDCLLHTQNTLPYSFSLRTGGAYTSSLAFSASGITASAISDTFRLCDSQQEQEYSRAIAINQLGRARLLTQAIQCP